MLSKLRKAWPDRWDEYVAPARWVERNLPDSSLPSNMTSFELLFSRKPRASLDSLVPLLDDAKQLGNLDNFVEQRNRNLLEVRKGLKQRHDMRVATRKRVNTTKNRSSIGVAVKAGNLVLVEEAGSTHNREGCRNNLHDEKYTDPWTVKRVLRSA